MTTKKKVEAQTVTIIVAKKPLWKCAICNKEIEIKNELQAAGHVWHKACWEAREE